MCGPGGGSSSSPTQKTNTTLDTTTNTTIGNIGLLPADIPAVISAIEGGTSTREAINYNTINHVIDASEMFPEFGAAVAGLGAKAGVAIASVGGHSGEAFAAMGGELGVDALHTGGAVGLGFATSGANLAERFVDYGSGAFDVSRDIVDLSGKAITNIAAVAQAGLAVRGVAAQDNQSQGAAFEWNPNLVLAGLGVIVAFGTLYVMGRN